MIARHLTTTDFASRYPLREETGTAEVADHADAFEIFPPTPGGWLIVEEPDRHTHYHVAGMVERWDFVRQVIAA